jgi:hypothetical protein
VRPSAISSNTSFSLRVRNGTYLLLTNSGDQYGNFNALRPFSIDNLNGNTQMGNNALFVNHGGNVGIGLANTSSKFGVAGGIIVDEGNVSKGLFPTGLQFGSTGTGEGIVSKRTAGGNQFGLDLITGGNARLTILNNGNVGIGVASPSYSLETKNRIRLRDGGSGETAGIWLNKAGNTGFGSFVGMTVTDNVGMYSPSLGKFTLTSNMSNGNLDVVGYTKMGTGAHAIKMVQFTGTISSTDGGFTSITHGLTASKIINVSVIIEYSPGFFVPNSYYYVLGYGINYPITPTLLNILNISSGGSASILGKPFVATVTYME